MKGPGLKRKLSLRIVHKGEEITGVAPRALERTAKGCTPGGEDHRAMIQTLATLAGYTARQTMPPSAARLMLGHLDTAHAWVVGQANLGHVNKARSEAFESIMAAEKRTTESVSQSMALMPRKAETGLDRHATTVVLRYAALAANYACGATILTLDAVSDPTKGLNLVTQAAGAISYQRLALGPALTSDFRASAWAQAEWEASRRGASDVYPAGALAVQLFHEFLGAQWKDQSDGMRSYFEDFINWALPHQAPS